MEGLSIPLRRQESQLLDRRPFGSAAEVVRWFGALQAQDERAARWAIALRTRHARRESVEAAIESRQVVRTWPMRGTLHFVPAEDAAWMLRLLTPRVIAGAARRHRELELDEGIFGRAGELLASELLQKGRLTRREVMALLEASGIATGGSRGSHILGYLAQTGLLCFGPREGKQETLVLLEEWVNSGRAPAREEALATVAERYFRSHGPATLKDFRWWSGLLASHAREALEQAEGRLERIHYSGQEYWLAADRPPPERRGGTSDSSTSRLVSDLRLLPWFDEFLVGYQDRSNVLEPKYAKAVNAGGGLLNPVMVVEGQVVATWRLQRRPGTPPTVEVSPFAEWSGSWTDGLNWEVERYGEFLEERLELVVLPGE